MENIFEHAEIFQNLFEKILNIFETISEPWDA